MSRKRIPSTAKDRRNLEEAAENSGWLGAVDRVPCKAEPREKCFCGEGLEMDPSHISAIEFSKRL